MQSLMGIRRVLVVDRDGRSAGVLFRALLRRAIDADPVLSLANITIENAGIGAFADVDEGKEAEQQVTEALEVLGLSCLLQESQNVKNHSELVDRSDLIIVPTLAEEDALCLAFDDASSKTLTLWDSMTLIGIPSLNLPDAATSEDYLKWAIWLEPVLGQLGRMLKESYSHASIAKGICRSKGVASGQAHVARHSRDLVGFRPGAILVIDHAGTLMFNDLEPQIATNIISGVDPGVEIVGLEDIISRFEDSLRSEPTGLEVATADGIGVLGVVVKNAAAVVCSRGDQYIHSLGQNVPRLAYCVGATDRISTGQRIIVDAEGGNVYDVSLLQNLS